ncbi:MAG: tripartite tricarboxylate transporter substrate binding protein [Proteobacteria bacterium]|nr:tripartite tricarboxylate transporter substrate binding protein [Burkholderiales bacterium]
MKRLGTTVCAATTVVFMLFGALDASAQAFPVKPVRMVVPFVAGGATDVIARLLAQGLNERWGQSVLVENRSGAGGSIGSEIVSKSNPDGYTLLFASGSVLSANQHMYKKMSHDPGRDLTGISLVASGPQVIAVGPASKFTTLMDLVNAVRTSPGKFTYGSAGVGSQVHLAAESFEYFARMDSVHVPYKGEVVAITDLIGGQIDWAAPNLGASINFIRDRKLRALAVTGPKRSPALPDVPTVSEAGITGFENLGWFGVAVASATPRDIINRIADDIAKVTAGSTFRERVAGLGMEGVGNRPDEFNKYIREEIARWGKIIRERKITAQ